MQLHDIATQVLRDTQASLWPATPGAHSPFAPELILCLTILGMLIVRLFRWGQQIPGFLLALVVVALGRTSIAGPPEAYQKKWHDDAVNQRIERNIEQYRKGDARSA